MTFVQQSFATWAYAFTAQLVCLSLLANSFQLPIHSSWVCGGVRDSIVEAGTKKYVRRAFTRRFAVEASSVEVKPDVSSTMRFTTPEMVVYIEDTDAYSV